MPCELPITLQADDAVDAELDGKLRAFLHLCFSEHDHDGTGTGFEHKRYHHESPALRFMVFDDELLVAHLAVHRKTMQVDEAAVRFIGIAEVCVHPSFRRQGLARRLVSHAEAAHADWPYALLFGDLEVYESSGYQPSPIITFPDVNRRTTVLAKSLAAPAWPAEADVTVPGPTF